MRSCFVPFLRFRANVVSLLNIDFLIRNGLSICNLYKRKNRVLDSCCDFSPFFRAFGG